MKAHKYAGIHHEARAKQLFRKTEVKKVERARPLAARAGKSRPAVA